MKFNVSSPVPEPFQFETLVDAQRRIQWIQSYWYHSIFWILLYIITIFGIKYYMRNRQAFDLHKPLIIWNLGLAIFSMVGTSRMIPGLFHITYNFGFTFSICDNTYGIHIQPTVFWGWLFLCSKVVELGDTVFIVLRKRKLVFLHYYHHIMTLLVGWYAASHLVAALHWLSVINFFVHSFMYFYFMITAINIKLPAVFRMAVTTIQLIQMVFGTTVCFWAILLKYNGMGCEFNYSVIAAVFFVGLTYIFLFGRMFYFSYIYPTLSKDLILKYD